MKKKRAKQRNKKQQFQSKYPFISEIVNECVQVAMNKIDYAEKTVDPLVKMEKGKIQCITEIVNAMILEDAHRAKEILTEISERIKSKEPWENWEVEEIQENNDKKTDKNQAIPPPPPMMQIPEFKVKTSIKENTTQEPLKPKFKISKIQKSSSISSIDFLNAKNKLKKVSSLDKEQQKEYEQQKMSKRRGSLLDLINSGLRQKFSRANIWMDDNDSQNSDSSETSDYSDEFD